MAGSASSTQYEVKGGGKRPYTVTINYDTGHWCTCRGMISKKKTYGEDSGRTQGTCCKHIKTIIETKFDGDWGKSTGKGKPRTRIQPAVASTPTTPAQPTGRRAAIMAQRARREEEKFGRRAAHKAQKASKTDSGLSLLDRIDALAAAREGVTS
jgi:hypothetical protein